MPAGNVPTSV